MKYEFEYKEIKNCLMCPLSNGAIIFAKCLICNAKTSWFDVPKDCVLRKENK